MFGRKSLRVHCESCSAPLEISNDTKVVNCAYCGTPYIVPHEIKDSSDIEKASAELAIVRLRKEYEELEEQKRQYLIQTQREIDEKNRKRDQINPDLSSLQSQKNKLLVKLIPPGFAVIIFLIFACNLLSVDTSSCNTIIVLAGFAGIGYLFLKRIKEIQNLDSRIESSKHDLKTTYSLDKISQLRSTMRGKENSYDQELAALDGKIQAKLKIVD